MNVTQQGTITLLKSAITGEKYELPKDFALEADEVKKIIKKHHLMQLVYVGAVNCGIPSDTPLMQSLFKIYCQQLIRSEMQMKEVQRIFQAFDENGIDYIPTKGCNMKALYPKPEMRLMGDADITIRKEQCPKIKKLMQELGFELQQDNKYNDVWNSKHLLVELHKQMRSFYNESYYDDVWDKMECVEGRHHTFKRVEDEFIHIFNHFARHYRGSGIGCRHMVDLYVFRRTYPQMDEAYICREMEKLKLQEFYPNVCQMLDVWFADGVSEEVTEALTQYIFSRGSWGDKVSFEFSKQVTEANEKGKVSNSRLKAIKNTIFLPKEDMLLTYNILEKAPFLLPFLWVVRGMRIVLFERHKIKRKTDIWQVVDDESVREYQRQYQLVGLDIEE